MFRLVGIREARLVGFTSGWCNAPMVEVTGDVEVLLIVSVFGIGVDLVCVPQVAALASPADVFICDAAAVLGSFPAAWSGVCGSGGVGREDPPVVAV